MYTKNIHYFDLSYRSDLNFKSRYLKRYYLTDQSYKFRINKSHIVIVKDIHKAFRNIFYEDRGLQIDNLYKELE